MKKLLFLVFCVPLLVVAQKKKNGTIYIEHPAIDIVKDLTWHLYLVILKRLNR